MRSGDLLSGMTAEVLILDEPAEGLDSYTERDVFNALAGFCD
jgi:ABC-type transport system involved in cytochrome bd biosynthesis fused ATPase/permease subunit